MTTRKVLISGGREVGGLASFADNLLCGFQELGIPGEVRPPRRLLSQWAELRDPTVLKILSTGAVFFAPLCRNTICVAHGFPRVDAQGILKAGAILASLKVAHRFSCLVSVSHYVKSHLKAVFNIPSSCVIYNPLAGEYLQARRLNKPRTYLTYVGRLNAVKNIECLIEPIRMTLDQYPHMKCLIIGEGQEKEKIRAQIGDDERFRMLGALPAEEVREYLAKSAVFFSGCETEALGIAYLEALSQGCKVVMPASGGGMEICLSAVGKSIFLLPLDFDVCRCADTIRTALETRWENLVDMTVFSPSSIARQYLDAARRF